MLSSVYLLCQEYAIKHLQFLFVLVFFKPFGDFFESSDPVVGFAGPGEFMVFALEPDISGVYSVVFEGGVELQAFHMITAIVFV